MKKPEALFRGDADPLRARKVVEFWNRGWLQTNLGNGGRGQEIFSSPLTTLVEKHVNATWDQTHFLSFSRSRPVAESFALGENGGRLAPLAATDEPWDTTVFTLDTACLTADREISPGIVYCEYLHKEFGGALNNVGGIARMMQDAYRMAAPVPVLLIDVLTALMSIGSDEPEIVEARTKASRDQEWLILPCEPFQQDGQPPALSALLDDSCIVKREKFRIQRD